MNLFGTKIERLMRLSYCLCVYSLVVENAHIVVAVVVEAVKERRKSVKDNQSNKTKDVQLKFFTLL